MTLVLVATVSWAIAVLPDSRQEQAVRDWLAGNAYFDWKSTCPSRETGQHYFKLTEQLFDGVYELEGQCSQRPKDSVFNRNLIIREQLLIANELKAEDEADLTSEDETVRQAALKKITGLILSGRDLLYADFSGSRLPNVNFVGADGKPSDLRYANFSNAMLVNAIMNNTKFQGANLSNAKLQKADLSGAKLQGAVLSGAKLQKAKLLNAKLQKADLHLANLQGANLSDAELQRAVLRFANLQEANLYNAHLQGADLRDAKLQEADLRDAKLQEAVLFQAELQEANLYHAKLQGANLRNAKLQGAVLFHAEVQGAVLSGAKLQGAVLSEANLSYSDITDAEFGLLSQQELKELQETIAQSIHDHQLLKRINDTLIERAKEQTTIPQATAKDVWDNDPSRLSKYGFSDALTVAKSWADYQNKLAAYLLDLSCSVRWAAVGIVQNQIEYSFEKTQALLAKSIAQCLLSLSDQKNKAGRFVCPAMSEIDKKTVAKLEEVAAQKNFNSSIQPIFSCQTELSDQKQPSE